MKLALKIFGALIILGLVGGGSYYYYSQPRVVNSYSEPVSMCSSPGAGDYYEKSGGVTYKRAGEPGDGYSGTEDYCDFYIDGKYSRSGRLRQSFCQGNTLVTEHIDCGISSVCRQGRCFKGSIWDRKQLQNWSLCMDSDGGMKREMRGWLQAAASGRDECYVNSDLSNLEGGTQIDQCSGPDCYVYEYYCDGDERAWKILPTPEGCENGAGKWTPTN